MNALLYRNQVREVMSKLLSEDEAPVDLLLQTSKEAGFHTEEKCWWLYYLRFSDINILHECLRFQKERRIEVSVLNYRLEDFGQCGFHRFNVLH